MISLQVSGASELVIQMQDLPAKVSRSVVRGLNRAIGSASTVIVRKIAADLGMKASDVRDKIRKTEATGSRLEARLSASLKRIPLFDFKATQGKRGVSYRLQGGRSRLPNAFIATMATGHTGVFERTPGKYMRFQKPTWKKKRQAIHEKFGPSLGHVFGKYRPDGLARAKEVFETTFAHEIEVRGDSGEVEVGAGAD